MDNRDTNNQIILLVGEPITEPSELRFLKKKLRNDLSKHKKSALIFANFFAGRHRQQIDFLLVISNCVCVVELINYNYPIFGKVNGPWELRDTDGNLIRLIEGRNPYRQALDAKYSINFEMINFFCNNPKLAPPSKSNEYLSAIESILCFLPSIPEGSNIPTGDFKTYVRGYEDFFNF